MLIGGTVVIGATILVIIKIFPGEGTGVQISDTTQDMSIVKIDIAPQATESPSTAPIDSMAKKDTNAPGESQIVITHPQYGFDPSDTKELVKNSDNVFVGTVLKKIGEKQLGEFSYPIFSVQVVSNIKGEAVGSVKIVQSDVGYRGGKTYISEGDVSTSGKMNSGDILLTIGATYVFSALYVKNDVQYGISAAPYDRALITTTSGLSGSQLGELALQNQRVKEFSRAATELGQSYKFQESFQ